MSPSDLAERTVHRRAVEAVIWGMPAVNSDLMYQADRLELIDHRLRPDFELA